MNTEQQLCVSFVSSTSSDQIVVLAHHTDNPTKLSADDTSLLIAALDHKLQEATFLLYSLRIVTTLWNHQPLLLRF